MATVPDTAGPDGTRVDEAAVVTVRRYDRAGPLLKATVRDSDGALLAEGIAVREGILLYRTADGKTRRELVTMDAVKDTARTLARGPVTLEHPREGFVRADNAKRLAVGDIDGETYVEEDAQGGFARVRLAIRHADAIEAAQSTHRELSPGYEVTLDETPGTHPVYGQYDARQIARSGNHLALVQRGRGGSTVGLHLDAADAVQVDDTPAGQASAGHRAAGRTNREDHMNPKLAALLTALGVKRLDDEGPALTDAFAAVETLKADAGKYDPKMEQMLEDAKAEIEKLKRDLEAAKGKADAAQGRVDELEAAEKARRDAADLEDLKALAAVVGVKADGLDLTGLRKAIACTRVDSVDGKSAEYIAAVIDTVRIDATKREDGVNRWDFAAKGDEGEPDYALDGLDPFFNPHLDARTTSAAGGDA